MIRNDVVMAIVDCSSAGVYEEFASRCELLIDITSAYPKPQIGWKLYGNKLVQPDGSPALDWRITRLSMRNRFTTSELLGIMNTANSNLMVQLIMDNNALAEYVDLSSPATQAAVGYFASLSLITADRMTEILSTPPATIELAFGGN